jgi:hypothetical protein
MLAESSINLMMGAAGTTETSLFFRQTFQYGKY